MSVSHTTNFDQSKAALEVLFPKVLEARESRVNEFASRIFGDGDLFGVICSQIKIFQDEKYGLKHWNLGGLDQLKIVNKSLFKVVGKLFELSPEYRVFLEEIKTDLVSKWKSTRIFNDSNTYTFNEVVEKIERQSLYHIYDTIRNCKNSQELLLSRVVRGSKEDQKNFFADNPNAFSDWVHRNREELEDFEELDLSWCMICNLPKEISAFKKLKDLNLRGNSDMSSLPPELLTLPYLEKVDVTLVCLSETFKKSTTYKTLTEKQIIVGE